MKFAISHFDADGTFIGVSVSDAPFPSDFSFYYNGVPTNVVPIGAYADTPDAAKLSRELHKALDADKSAEPKSGLRWKFNDPAHPLRAARISSPCTEHAIIAAGPDAIPPTVLHAIKQKWARCESLGARHFRAVGLSFDEIRALPRFKAAKERAGRLASDTNVQFKADQQAADASAAAAAVEAERIRNERIARRLNKGP